MFQACSSVARATVVRAATAGDGEEEYGLMRGKRGKSQSIDVLQCRHGIYSSVAARQNWVAAVVAERYEQYRDRKAVCSRGWKISGLVGHVYPRAHLCECVCACVFGLAERETAEAPHVLMCSPFVFSVFMVSLDR